MHLGFLAHPSRQSRYVAVFSSLKGAVPCRLPHSMWKTYFVENISLHSERKGEEMLWYSNNHTLPYSETYFWLCAAGHSVEQRWVTSMGTTCGGGSMKKSQSEASPFLDGWGAKPPIWKNSHSLLLVLYLTLYAERLLSDMPCKRNIQGCGSCNIPITVLRRTAEALVHTLNSGTDTPGLAEWFGRKALFRATLKHNVCSIVGDNSLALVWTRMG